MRSFRAPRTPTAAAQPGLAAILITILTATSVLAGCLGDEAEPPAPGSGDTTTDTAIDPSVLVAAGNEKVRDLRTDLKATDSVPAPGWTVGDQFGHHVFFGSDDNEGIHLDAVVHEVTAGTVRLATPDRETAAFHALYGIPVLGDISTDDLSSTGLGGLWKLYEFPITDGKTWTGEIPNIAFDIIDDDRVPITFTATYVPEIETLAGTYPGFTIEGHTDDGTLIVETDYLPEIRWYNRLLVHDIDPGQDPIEFEIRSMGHSRGWTGDLVSADAETLAITQDTNGFDNPPWDGGQPRIEPEPTATFDVPDDVDSLYLFAGAAAVIGVRQSYLITPDGETMEWQALSTSIDGGSFSYSEQFIDAIPGTWQWITAGAGGMSQGFLYAAGVNYETITIE